MSAAINPIIIPKRDCPRKSRRYWTSKVNNKPITLIVHSGNRNFADKKIHYKRRWKLKLYST